MEPKQYYIGIDVGGTSVKEGLFDEDGNLLAKASVPTPPIVDAAGFAAVTEAIDQVVAKAQIPRAFVSGIGLAVPCPIPASGDAKVKANIAINLPELKIAIQEHCPDAVVKYENDANAAAMGEAWLGSAKGVQNVVMVTIGTGVGGGVIVNGDVVSGVVGAGGEIGHMCLNPAEERTCGCGGHGHLEQYSSATGVVSNYLAECKKAGVEPIELTGPSDSKDVFQACREGDKLAGMRVIPLVIEEEKLRKAEQAAGDKPLLSLKPYVRKTACIVATGGEVKKGLIQDTFPPVVIDKLRTYGIETLEVVYSGDGVENVRDAVLAMREKKPDMILCTGGMSVDPDDNTPGGIKAAGANIIAYGAPVLPGAMFLLGYFDDGMPVMGLPGCVMYAGATVFDLMLPKIAADVPVTRSDIAALGEGGLCLGCKPCHYPICPFGR